MKILYITKLRDSKACGVTNAVIELLNHICEYAEVSWLELGNGKYDFNPKIQRISAISANYLECDIAVFEDPFASVEFCLIAKILEKNDIPYIICPHGCFHKLAMKHHYLKKRIAIITIFKRFLDKCSAVQYLTDSEMEMSYKKGKGIIIPNGINKQQINKTRTKPEKICFIARKTVWTKGIDLLLAACKNKQKELREKDVKLYLYGSIESNKDERYINEYIKNNNIQDIVVNCGPVFDDEKEKVLIETDVFIQTSRHEGFPMSILEALSYGIPVAITKDTNLSQMVKEYDCGFCCETSEGAISNMIDEILNSTTLQNKSLNAYRLASECSWDNVCKKTIQIYEMIKKEENE